MQPPEAPTAGAWQPHYCFVLPFYFSWHLFTCWGQGIFQTKANRTVRGAGSRSDTICADEMESGLCFPTAPALPGHRALTWPPGRAGPAPSPQAGPALSPQPWLPAHAAPRAQTWDNVESMWDQLPPTRPNVLPDVWKGFKGAALPTACAQPGLCSKGLHGHKSLASPWHRSLPMARKHRAKSCPHWCHLGSLRPCHPQPSTMAGPTLALPRPIWDWANTNQEEKAAQGKVEALEITINKTMERKQEGESGKSWAAGTSLAQDSPEQEVVHAPGLGGFWESHVHAFPMALEQTWAFCTSVLTNLLWLQQAETAQWGRTCQGPNQLEKCSWS